MGRGLLLHCILDQQRLIKPLDFIRHYKTRMLFSCRHFRLECYFTDLILSVGMKFKCWVLPVQRFCITCKAKNMKFIDQTNMLQYIYIVIYFKNKRLWTMVQKLYHTQSKLSNLYYVRYILYKTKC